MKLWQKATGVVICGPLGLWMIDLYPPVGADSFLLNSVFSITLCAIGYVIGISLVNRHSKTPLRSGIILSLAIVSLCIYAVGYQLYVREVEQKVNGQMVSQKIVVGYELRNTGDDIYNTQELLMKYGNVENIWTKESIKVITTILFISYNLSFLLLTLGLVFAHKRE